MQRECVIATRSAGKVREILAILKEFGLTGISLSDAGIAFGAAEDTLEVFDTFEENALAKAQWFFELAGGRAVFADDSGLEVDALGGMPGVRSKRWSGRDDLDGEALDRVNNEFLFSAIDRSGADAPYRARYVCAAACVSSAGSLVAVGSTDGELVRHARGAAGFGYDPHFFSYEAGQTFAELTTEQKGFVSHRGRAFRSLLARCT